MKFQVLPLGQVTNNFDTKRVPIKESERKKGHYPYYGASGVVDHVQDYIFDGEYLLIAEDGENLRTRQTPIAFRANGKFWVNNHAHIVTGNDRALTRYLEYAVNLADINSYLSGSTMPKLTQGNLNRLPVVIPPVDIQKQIIQIVGSIDDKIELNNQINVTLESIARAVFKEWFIDFGPVKAKSEGKSIFGMTSEASVLFPSEFQDSVLGMIPKGWQAQTVTDLFEVNPKYSLKKGEMHPYTEMKDLPVNSACVSDYVERAFSSGSKFKNGDTLVARITPCLENGKTAFVNYLPVDATAWGSTEFIVLRSKNSIPLEASYLLARMDEFRNHLILNMSGSSGRQRVPDACLHKYYLANPPDDIWKIFERLVAPMFKTIRSNAIENNQLSKIRNLVLPKLILGEINLKELNV